MGRRNPGFAFRLTGLILGIVGAVTATVAIVFAGIGMHKAHQCKHCKLEDLYK